jgi:hypothetical protein
VGSSRVVVPGDHWSVFRDPGVSLIAKHIEAAVLGRVQYGGAGRAHRSQSSCLWRGGGLLRILSQRPSVLVTFQVIFVQTFSALIFAIQAPLIGPQAFGLVALVMIVVGFFESVVTAVTVDTLDIGPGHRRSALYDRNHNRRCGGRLGGRSHVYWERGCSRSDWRPDPLTCPEVDGSTAGCLGSMGSANSKDKAGNAIQAHGHTFDREPRIGWNYGCDAGVFLISALIGLDAHSHQVRMLSGCPELDVP